jgi:DNA-binding response OmpR family regulator
MNASDWYKLDYHNEPINPEQFEAPVKYGFDASQMRELRKPYKKLLKYADTMLKLNSEGIENDEKLSEQVSVYRDRILDLFADEDKTYLSYYHLLRQCQHHKWNGKEYDIRCNIGMIKRYIDKQIKLENPQVLVEVQPATTV